MDSKFCPYCGSPLAGDGRYCDACGSEMLPGDALTADQLRNWVRLPQSGLLWAFGLGAASVGIGYIISILSMTSVGIMGAMLVISAGATLSAGVAFAGYLVIRHLFGHLAARPLDRMLGASLSMAAAFGFWPLLGLLMAAL